MNANGVVLELQGPEAGFEASASLSGMGISVPWIGSRSALSDDLILHA
jgi:hypothetical protein